jgi:hypothetical protein
VVLPASAAKGLLLPSPCMMLAQRELVDQTGINGCAWAFCCLVTSTRISPGKQNHPGERTFLQRKDRQQA